ncbi:uncharacterized protein SEPMUDRAFT_151565 [Sphaerulina musiva SO2202]|uniref:Uncharacterized protein n=1 Tax=Sphaerulina musiva (strain SO2202) TaxID=692275 RepID=N1QI00_SPHMS|nr:uncharacterized protein SEPMUDRAFT_151565 [Sphaerulina musiva SO2202]EMF09604.1 hypothetical protein SEPMUDRAFT_151565 [Sphaerulina musiva SO2202]
MCRCALCWTAEVGIRVEEVTLASTDKLSNSPEALLLASQDRSGCNDYDEVADGVPSTRTELPRVVWELCPEYRLHYRFMRGCANRSRSNALGLLPDPLVS